jgi:undecaprenyl-diphosphatase
MDPLRVIILALLQGITELFPVSSLGHTVIIPGLLGWGDLLQSPVFLPLVVTLHLGTAAALLTFFWRDWVKLLRGGMRVLAAGKFTREADPDGYGRQFALVIVGTVPAGLVGVLFQKFFESNFSYPILAAALLCANGAVLLAVERLSKSKRVALAAAGGVTMGATARAGHGEAGMASGEVGTDLSRVSFFQAALIGAAQTFALLPGISRSGATMVAGMSSGLSREQAARFSFLLATPIILGAGVLEVPKLLHNGLHIIALAAGGGVLAGIAAYLSVRFLMRFFETRTLDPFAFYCVGAGVLVYCFFLLQYLNIVP